MHIVDQPGISEVSVNIARWCRRRLRGSFAAGAFAAIIGIGASGAYADCVPGAPAGAVDWVNTYIGTGGGGVEYGGTMPLVTTPFGMTNWTAQTRQNRISVSSYAYEDTYIQGFIGTHQPAIWMGDYGYLTLMPEIGSINYAPEARRLPFTHQDEISTPYYYSVTMAAADPAHRIDADMTATDHAGYLRFRFPRGAQANVLIEATRPAIKGFVAINAAEREITGYNPDRMDANLGPLRLPNFKGYFVVRFKQPFAAKTVYEGVLMWPGKNQVEGVNVGAFVSFDTTDGGLVEARVGTSFISIEQARANLDQEIPDWNFERTCGALRTEWNRKRRAACPWKAPTMNNGTCSTPGCTTHCCTRSCFPSMAVTTAPSTTRCTTALLTRPTRSGIRSARRTAC